MSDVNDEELLKVIGDFIEMGHVENIVSMFKKDPDMYKFLGDLVRDERFMVRMGTAVLIEELAADRPAEVAAAVPWLKALLGEEPAYVRGDACNLLAIIGTPEARELLETMRTDRDPQVREIVTDALDTPD